MTDKRPERYGTYRNPRPGPKRSLGQNFLVHPPTVRTIAEFVHIPKNRTVIELGTGRGALTLELARRTGPGGRVIGYELDRELAAWLENENILPAGVELRVMDMLDIPLKALSTELSGPLVIAGNLPYNISSQVVIKLIEEKECLQQAVLMFQKEVAERLVAGPGSKKYGILSVLAGHCFSMRKLMDIPPGLFSPRPKVVSSVVEISPRVGDTGVDDYNTFKLIVKAAFSKRRKTIKNAMSSLFAPHPAALDHVLMQAGIQGQMRAETVSIKKFTALARLSRTCITKTQ